MGMGFEAVGLVLGSLYFGSMIDQRFSWPGYATAGLIVLTLMGWIYHVIVLLKKFMDGSE